MQKAAAIVCVSQATRNELIKRDLVDPERTHVVHNGIGPIFSPELDFTADLEAEQLVGPREPGVVEILHVGSAVPRKRLDVLLKVLSDIRRSGERVRLIRVGPAFPPQWQPLADQLTAEDAIRSVPFVSSGVLAALYRRALLLLQTSEAEGFGLPLAEAMACGTVAVASDIPVLREIGGTAVLYCPIGNISIWADTVSSLINQSREEPAQFARRRRAAIAQAALFSCRAHAARMLEVYATVTGTTWPYSFLTSALDAKDARPGLRSPRCGASRLSQP
jgi:glycosyltransferase involved in cell wall biosynthesis